MSCRSCWLLGRIDVPWIALFFPIRCKLADDGGGTAQQTTAVGRPFSWFYAIDRSLKNNDQKDIPLDDRDWAKARDVFIVRRHGRAGDMSFVTDLRGAIVADYDLRGSRFARLQVACSIDLGADDATKCT